MEVSPHFEKLCFKQGVLSPSQPIGSPGQPGPLALFPSHAPSPYLVEEAIDHVQVSRRIGGKDAGCAVGARDYELVVGKGPDCI